MTSTAATAAITKKTMQQDPASLTNIILTSACAPASETTHVLYILAFFAFFAFFVFLFF